MSITERAVERTVRIDAPVDAVWQALTDADELTRWFPLEARVTPGVGGSVWMAWRHGNEVDDTRIEVWEPGRHLRCVGRSGTWLGIATDYHLERDGNRTVLRVVSSGFGEGDAWDDLLRAYGSGWDFELRGLRHYLERHRGVPRLVASARAPYAAEDAAVWAQLTGPGGWFGADGVGHLAPGTAFRAQTATGHALRGTVQSVEPPKQWVAIVEDLNDALLRVQLYGREASVWLSTYGVPEPDVRALERAWRASLATLLPATR